MPSSSLCDLRELRFCLFEDDSEFAIFSDVNVTQQLAQLFAQHAVTTRLRGLPSETVYLSIDLGNDVGDARKIRARRFKTRFSRSLSHAKLRNAGRFFNDGAPVHRLRGKNLSDAALLDDGVVTAGQARSGKEILDIAQAANLPVQQVLALA